MPCAGLDCLLRAILDCLTRASGPPPEGAYEPYSPLAQAVSSAAGTLYTLHPTPYTLHPTPYTLHPSQAVSSAAGPRPSSFFLIITLEPSVE